jgi:hypothetical protein
MKRTAEQKAKRIRVKEVQAALDGQFCRWLLALPDISDDDDDDAPFPEPVYCDKPGWQKTPTGELLCPYHASFKTLKAVRAERTRQGKKFKHGDPRAKIIAIRDGVAA